MDAANYLYTTKASIVISGLVEDRSFIRLRIFAPRLQISIARSPIRGGGGAEGGEGKRYMMYLRGLRTPRVVGPANGASTASRRRGGGSEREREGESAREKATRR